MKQYAVTLTGLTPLLLHRDNLSFSEAVKAWQVDPQNKEFSTAGDDRSPAWTWIGCLYSDGKHIGMDSDNIMTMLREGGAKLKTGKGQETYKKQTQYGIVVDQIQADMFVRGKQIPVEAINALVGNMNFEEHEAFALNSGFELFVKRAKIQSKKHVRVRPLFRDWVLQFSITVIDEEQSGITQSVLQRILDLAGGMCGLGDWRPSSKTPGSFGKFSSVIEAI